MIAAIAILICSLGVAFLFYLDRDKSVRTSKALWIPVLWIAIAGSRPASQWFGMNSADTLAATVDGSPFDAAVYGVLLIIGLIVLVIRRKKTARYLPVLLPVVAYATYCLISVMWSPVPFPALKRWSKDLGDMAMVVVIATETDPIYAIRRLYSRLGFLLLPLSVVLIHYTTFGRQWNQFGTVGNVGVANNKNSLGLLVFVISLGALWNVCSLVVHKKQPNRTRRLIAQSALLAFGLILLAMAHSSTSVACFALGSILMLSTSLPAIRTSTGRVHMVCLTIILAGVLTLLLGGTGDVAEALGRQSTFTGRTDIWAAVIPTVPSAVIGAGFDSYWNSPGAAVFAHNLNTFSHWYHAEQLNEAHDGYIEVYLNLGWIGVSLIVLILVSGYRNACRAFKRNPEVASLMLAYIVTSMFYNITEAGFRTLNPMWIFLLLSTVSVSGINAGFFGNIKSKSIDSRRRTVSQWDAIQDRSPEKQATYAAAGLDATH